MIGVNISPGWGDTVDGRDIAQMESVISELRPGTLRMPWVQVDSDGGRTRETIRFALERGIDTLVIDNATWAPEEVVDGIAAAADAGLSVTAVEGVNEADLPPTGYTTTPVPIPPDQLAAARDRQQRLYDAVAGRWPVLTPSAAYRVNVPALAGLAGDIASMHLYPLNGDFPPTPEAAVIPAVGKPVWVTETGVTSYKKRWLIFSWKWVVTPEQQRDYLVSMVGMLRENGAERVIVYSMQNTGPNAFRNYNNFGLYTWDGVVKPAGVALRGA